jgi:hypothetical protein
MAKNPLVAGLLNFFLPGIGYVYNGKRIKLGIVIFGCFILVGFLNFRLSPFNPVLFPLPFYFSYFGSKEAAEINEAERVGKSYIPQNHEIKPKNLLKLIVVIFILAFIYFLVGFLI